MENVEVITKYDKTDFGEVWYVNAVDKSFRFALYKYDDDADTIYLSNVFVKKDKRGQGYGNVILNSAEKTAKKMGASIICLKVKNGSFAHQWYVRHGYTDFTNDEEDPSYIWMKKEIM